MFAGRIHQNGMIKLDVEEEKLFRLPPMSSSKVIPVVVEVFDAFETMGPHGTFVFHDGPSSDLELELRHGNHFSQDGINIIRTISQTHDDLWRLRVRRLRRNPDPAAPSEPRQYRIRVRYPSQLPIIERRIPAGFFHEGFAVNYNQQQYLKIRFGGSFINILVRADLADLYGLKSVALGSDGGDFTTIKKINTGRVSFSSVDMKSLNFDVGAGAHPGLDGNGLFFSVRGDFPKIGVNIDVPGDAPVDINPSFDVSPFKVTFRFFLTSFGDEVHYVPTVESNLLDRLDFSIPGVGNIKQKINKSIEDALNSLQFGSSGVSLFGHFLKPWLVGGAEELLSLRYARGPNDQTRPDRTVEPATGDLVVKYVGPHAKLDTTPVLLDSSQPPAEAVDDKAIRLFDLPDEDPDSVPGGGDGGSLPGDVSPFGGVTKPDIGALAKIEHIVVLMQENRSFDQVLGYLSRDKINPKVNGLLPTTDPEHLKQVNRFRGRNFLPQKADRLNPERFSQVGNPTPGATAWPSFKTPGPCHATDCVLTQMEPNPEAPDIPMGNFVADYAHRLGVQDSTDLRLRLVMDYFGPDDLPVFAVLARQFGICDKWYTAHAGSTWPNRFVMLTGDLNLSPHGEVETDNPDFGTLIPLQVPTLFDILSERGASWRVFEHGYSFLRLYKKFTFDTENIVDFDDPVRGFERAASRGELPQVTLIEPDYIDLPPGNDDHPPADMKFGQMLVRRIVQALVDSPQWEKTLLVITYDEHGGFYDHQRPPSDAPPLRGGRRKLGPRVPTFVISPLIERDAVFKNRFDHTSIGATILRRFAGRRVPRVSPRLDAARDLREVLTLDTPRPRSDFAELFASLPPPAVNPQRSTARLTDSERAKPIGLPQGKDDFHWLLSAARMITGEAPRGRSQRIRPAGPVSGQLLHHRDRARNGTGQVADPSVIGLGGWQNFKSVFSGGNGVIYAVDQKGELLLYRDKTQDGTGDVANPTVVSVSGWQDFKTVFSGGDGIIYAIDQKGRLLFHRDNTRDGNGAVSGPSVIGLSGWQDFMFLFSGGEGSIYAVDQKGRLLFFRDARRNGTGDVANPKIIGQRGWQDFKSVFPGGNGIIYAVDSKGRLLFHRDLTRDGTGQVASPSVIGLSGWQGFKIVFSGGEGSVYAVVA
jgi:phospholipase C